MGLLGGTAFPAESAAVWTQANTPTIWIISFLYLAIVLICPGRIPVYKHGLLPLWYRWNGIFQLCLLIAFSPEMMMVLSNGWRESVCRTGSLYSGTFSGTIVLLFVISKVVDLAETILIIMEGRSPLVLHIIHHTVTLIYTWHSYAQQYSVARWFVFANLFAHVILYSYLTPHKFGLRPCWLMVCITQILQLVVCLLVSITAQGVLERGGKCDVDQQRLSLDKFVCAVFIIMFADFYHGKWRKFLEDRECIFGNSLRSPDNSSLSDRSSSTRMTRTCSRADSSSRHGWEKTGITPSNRGYTSQ